MRRLIVVVAFALGMGSAIAACGNATTSPSKNPTNATSTPAATIPELSPGTDGNFVAHVPDAAAADAACQQKDALSEALKQLGVASGTGEIIAFEIGTPDASGQQAMTLCSVTVK